MRLPIPPPGLSGTKDSNIKNVSHLSTQHSGIGLLDEFEGVINGHRDGHGYVTRDDGEPDIYLPPNEMRAVLHRDRVKARIVRHDRKGRPEGRVVEIIERPPQPIIGPIDTQATHAFIIEAETGAVLLDKASDERMRSRLRMAERTWRRAADGST